MKKNLHAIDRTIRVLIALAVALLYFTHVISGTLAVVLGIVAVVFAVTAFINFCPLYALLGISTRKRTE